MTFINLIAAATMPDWLSNSVPVIKSFLIAVIFICSVLITIVVLSMRSTGDGAAANSITGSSGIQDSFYKKNMASSKEGRLKRNMTILSITIAVTTVIYFIFSITIDKIS